MCTKKFSETKGTALYRLNKDAELVVIVIMQLMHGCPTQEIVYMIDESEARSWLMRAGEKGRKVHEQLNATLPQYLTQIIRRTPSLAHRADTLAALMFLFGPISNFCRAHTILSLLDCFPRTVAVAARLTITGCCLRFYALKSPHRSGSHPYGVIGNPNMFCWR